MYFYLSSTVTILFSEWTTSTWEGRYLQQQQQQHKHKQQHKQQPHEQQQQHNRQQQPKNYAPHLKTIPFVSSRRPVFFFKCDTLKSCLFF